MGWEGLKARAGAILEQALRAVAPGPAVQRHLRLEENRLRADGLELPLERVGAIWVVGGGKAGRPMAQALEELLGERIRGGVVNVTAQAAGRTPGGRIRLHPAGHPIPSPEGLRGAREMAGLLEQAGPQDLVICLLSGGASALLSWPVEGVSLEELQELTGLLLESGADIRQVNAVRKHCTRLGGGGLARLAGGARLLTLALSDVVGDPPDAIGSGPTVPDPSSFAQAWEVLGEFGLLGRTPASIRRHLERGLRGQEAETPKPGDAAFQHAHYVLVGRNLDAAQAAADYGRRLGYQSLILSTRLQGEARVVARVLAGLTLSVRHDSLPLPPPACLVAGGETTVTVRGHGLGGRNSELALAAAFDLEGAEGILLASFATDGVDGPTEGAGAMAGGSTLERARRSGLDARRALEGNDSYTFFQALGDILRTGPTETNVNDLFLILVDPS